jgi:MFS transporter, ACS family, hexuronate transporter
VDETPKTQPASRITPQGGRRLRLVLCAFLHGLNHALQLALPPLYVAIRDDLRLEGLSPVMLLGTVYFVVYALSGIPYGLLADRFNKKRILVIGTLVNSLAFILIAYSHSYGLLVAAMVLGGLGGGAYHPVGNALISNLFKDMVGRAFGIAGMGASLGLFMGPFASGFLSLRFGWRVSCLLFALFGIAVTAAFALVMPEESGGRDSRKEEAAAGRALLAGMIPLIAIFALRDFCMWGTTFLTPAMTQSRMGFTEGAAGLVIGLMSLTGVVSQPLAGTLSDRFGGRKVVALALAFCGLFIILFPHAGPLSIYGLALFAGFAILSTVPVIDAAAAKRVPPSMRGRLFGVTMTLGILLGALSPYIVGLIHDVAGGYTPAYLAMGAAAILGAILSMVFFTR